MLLLFLISLLSLTEIPTALCLKWELHRQAVASRYQFALVDAMIPRRFISGTVSAPYNYLMLHPETQVSHPFLFRLSYPPSTPRDLINSSLISPPSTMSKLLSETRKPSPLNREEIISYHGNPIPQSRRSRNILANTATECMTIVSLI